MRAKPTEDLWARRILAEGVCGSGVYLQAQLYAHFLAAIYGLFGPDPQSALWVQAVLALALAFAFGHPWLAGVCTGLAALVELGRLAASRGDDEAVARWRERFVGAGGPRAVWGRLLAGP